MQVFLSWSGDNSRMLASSLHDWLKMMFPEIDFWLSSRSIEPGERWGQELDRQLEGTEFGVLCLLPTNLQAPWLLFEAGALSKSVETSRVIPFCLGFRPQEISGPLSRFQGLAADFPSTLERIERVNLATLQEALWSRQFEIVHLLGFVEPKTGDLIFDEKARLPASGLRKLLEKSQTELLFLATCDSLTLGAILSRNLSVIAASDSVDTETMIAWEKCFYGFLSKGGSLTSSYDAAQSIADLPMRLLMRSDAFFLPRHRKSRA